MRLFAGLLLSLSGTVVSAQTSEAIVEQVGSLHVASVTQFASIASLAQFGMRNEVRIEQSGRSNVQITQDGTGNVLAGIDALTGFGLLVASAFQFDASTLLLSQSGIDNQAFVHQDTGAYATITQTGTGNSVTLVQRGGVFQ